MTPAKSPPGTITPLSHLILMATADRARHGYAIIQEIERLSDGLVSPKAGSLYAALERLVGEDLLRESPEAAAPDDDARRIYYTVTKDGRKALNTETLRLARLLGEARAKRVVTDAALALALGER